METIFGLLVLVANVYAIIKIFQSSVDALNKAIWIVVILVLPIIGLIIWYFAGPGGNKS